MTDLEKLIRRGAALALGEPLNWWIGAGISGELAVPASAVLALVEALENPGSRDAAAVTLATLGYRYEAENGEQSFRLPLTLPEPPCPAFLPREDPLARALDSPGLAAPVADLVRRVSRGLLRGEDRELLDTAHGLLDKLAGYWLHSADAGRRAGVPKPRTLSQRYGTRAEEFGVPREKPAGEQALHYWTPDLDRFIRDALGRAPRPLDLEHPKKRHLGGTWIDCGTDPIP